MKTNDLIAKYLSCHSHAHVRARAASVTEDLCYVPRPSGLRDREEDGMTESATDAAAVCYVP